MRTSPMQTESLPAAVLVDSENVPRWALPGICKKLEEDGAELLGLERRPVRVDVRRIYGDWSRPDMASWAPHVRASGFRQVQQMRYATAKDVVDQRMTIDAMDLLHQDGPMLIGLASSDSDFVPLVQRLREAGCFVVGFLDAEKAPVSYRETCNATVGFHQVEGHKEAQAVAATLDQTDLKKSLREFMLQAFEKASGGQRWVHLAHLGQVIKDLDPDFDATTHGHKRLVDLVKALDDDFEVEKENGDGKPPIYKVALTGRHGGYRV